MTGTVAHSAEPTELLGQWQLNRWVRDDIAGLSGTASGQLTLRAEDQQIAWDEQGTLEWNGARMPFSRSYVLRRIEDYWWLFFQDGQPFHPWNPGQWVHHPCAEDDYRGLVTIDGPDSWHTLWEVRGPATKQRISSDLSRPVAVASGA